MVSVLLRKPVAGNVLEAKSKVCEWVNFFVPSTTHTQPDCTGLMAEVPQVPNADWHPVPQ